VSLRGDRLQDAAKQERRHDADAAEKRINPRTALSRTR